MSNKLIDTNALLYFKQKLDVIFAKKVDKVDGKGLSSNDYTSAEKNKLDGIDVGANKTIVVDNLSTESSANALSAKQGKALNEKIEAINTSIEDLGAGDMLKSVYDSNGNGKVDDADKLGGLAPSAYENKIDTVKVDGVAVAISEKTVNISLTGKVDKETGKGLSSNDYTSTEKTKLEGIESGANKTTVTDNLTSTSATNALSAKQGKALKDGLDSLSDVVSGKADASAIPTSVGSFSDAKDYAKKTDIANAYIYKGSVAAFSNLPASATAGSVYNVEDSGMNYAWNGSEWDNLGAIYSFDYAENADIDSMF